MLKGQHTLFRQLNVVIDALIVAVSFYLAYFIRLHLPLPKSIKEFVHYAWLLLIIIPTWNVVFYLNGLYPANRLRKTEEAIWIIVKSIAIGTAIIIVILFSFRIIYISRVIVVIFSVLCVLFMSAKEISFRQYFNYLRRTKKSLTKTVIIGEKGQVNKLHELIVQNKDLGLDILGYAVIGGGPKIEDSSLKYLGSSNQIHRVIHKQPVDLVVVGLPKERLSEIEEPLSVCEKEGVELWIAADIFHVIIAKPSIDQVDGIPFLVFKTTPKESWQLLSKRIMDIIVSFTLLIVTSPILLLVGILIKFTSPGPIVFKQKRVSLRGRRFILFKFRSMETNAEQRKRELRKLNVMKGPVFKIKDDPRITKIGKFLRRTSLDELPQLWNVLRGDMSLVGPRPPLPSEVAKYKGWHRRRLSMRPGITCLWQTSGRSQIKEFDKWAQLDLQYIDNWSLWLDIKILAKTILVVLSRSGAE